MLNRIVRVPGAHRRGGPALGRFTGRGTDERRAASGRRNGRLHQRRQSDEMLFVVDGHRLILLLLLLLQMDGERTWYVRGSRLWQRGRPSSWHVAPSLERLSAGDVVAVRRAADASMRLAVNGHDVALRVPALPADVYVVVDLHGPVRAVRFAAHLPSFYVFLLSSIALFSG